MNESRTKEMAALLKCAAWDLQNADRLPVENLILAGRLIALWLNADENQNNQ